MREEPGGVGPAEEGGSGVEGDRWTGSRIGPYEVLREVGRGGTGVVLLARRADGWPRREVAVKVVPGARVDDGLAARLRAETRVLGHLDHPNVARILDAGVTAEGVPFLVMEYVDGPPLDAWADSRALDVRARLRLFLQLLDGVDHAHGRGVVHRDLKPSNVRVTADGVPRLLDFGLARLVEAAGGGDSAPERTRTGERRMTPGYASPEQVRGEPVDVRSDVYSLGVLLHRLLTGRSPYRLDATTPAALARAVREQMPARPSEVVTRPVADRTGSAGPAADPGPLARCRATTPDGLSRILRGDLDTILLHALAKEPGERYATAAAFADDVRRYLEGRPIRARPPGRIRRLVRFARRRSGLVAAGLAAALVASTLGWQLREATDQRQAAVAADAELTRFVASIVETLGEETSAGDPGPTPRRLAAVEAAVAALDSLEAGLGGPPDAGLLEALAAAHQEVGVVQGHPTYANVGRIDDAEVSFQRSLELWSRLAEAEPDHPFARLEVAETRILLADLVLARGELEAHGAHLDAAEAILGSVKGAHDTAPYITTDAMLHERQARRWMILGDFGRGGRYAEALPDLARRSAELAEEGTGKLAALEEVPLALELLSILRSREGDGERALAIQLEAARLADSVADLPGATLRMERIRIRQWIQLGLRHNEAFRHGEAEEALHRAVGAARDLHRTDPADLGARADLAQAVFGRGQARIQQGKWEDALGDHIEVQAILEPLLPVNQAMRGLAAAGLRQIGEAHSRLGRFDEAGLAYDRAFAIYRELEGEGETAQLLKLRALAEISLAIHHRLRALAGEEAAACGPAAEAEARGERLWARLRAAGQVTPGEELIWEDTLRDLPAGVCGA